MAGKDEDNYDSDELVTDGSPRGENEDQDGEEADNEGSSCDPDELEVPKQVLM